MSEIKLLKHQRIVVSKLKEVIGSPILFNKLSKIGLNIPIGGGTNRIILRFLEEIIQDNQSQKISFIYLSTSLNKIEQFKYNFFQDNFFKNYQNLFTLDNPFRNNIFDDFSIIIGNVQKLNEKSNIRRESDRGYSFDEVIKNTVKKGTHFLLIIDGNISKIKIDEIIDLTKSKKIIYLSDNFKSKQYLNKKDDYNNYIDLSIDDIIQTGIIKEGVILNDNININDITNDILLLESGIKKKIELEKIIKNNNEIINPLILIYTINDNIEKITDYLISKGYKNDTIAIFFANKKTNLEGISDLKSNVNFLLLSNGSAEIENLSRGYIIIDLIEKIKLNYELIIKKIIHMPFGKHVNNHKLNKIYFYSKNANYEDFDFFKINKFEKYKLLEIINNIKISQKIQSKKLYEIFTALTVSNFLILSGPSGVGKTSLVGKLADELNGEFFNFPIKSNFTDESGLLGYWNPLLSRYEGTEVLKHIFESAKNQNIPYFLLLDEMNLSRIENYFSEFLSRIDEIKSVGAEIKLFDVLLDSEGKLKNIRYFKNKYSLTENEIIVTNGDFEDIEKDYDENHQLQIEVKINLYSNLHIIGTINEDETTNSLSNKVLDRAFYINLGVDDLFEEGEDKFLENIKDENYQDITSKNILPINDSQKELEKYKDFINKINEQIQEINKNDAIGYRTFQDIATYIKNYKEFINNPDEKEILDIVFCQKVWPIIKNYSIIGEKETKFEELKKEVGEYLLKNSESYKFLDSLNLF